MTEEDRAWWQRVPHSGRQRRVRSLIRDLNAVRQRQLHTRLIGPRGSSRRNREVGGVQRSAVRQELLVRRLGVRYGVDGPAVLVVRRSYQHGLKRLVVADPGSRSQEGRHLAAVGDARRQRVEG